MKIGFSLHSAAYSGSRFFMSAMKSRISSSAPDGRSWATPPGRMNAWFMRSPVISSKRSSTSSRSRKPIVITVRAPISMPPVAMATRWEEIRLSSISRTRMTWAFSGIWSSTSSSRSTPKAYVASL